MRYHRAGISLYPKLEGLFGLFHVAGNHLMKASSDEILFRLTRSVAEFVRSSSVFGIHAGFTDTGIGEAQPGIGECEIRVEFDGVLIKRNTCGISNGVTNLKTRAEGFQGFERWRGRLFKRSIELLDRTQRLAQFVSNL